MKKVRYYRFVMMAFCLTVAVSALLLVPATLNYLQFYVALNHVHLRINSFNIYTVNVGQFRDAVVSANLSIVQNSSYVGLKSQTVDIIVYYDKDDGYSQILFSRKFIIPNNETSLGPYSHVDLIISNDTYLYYYPLFANYNNQTQRRGEPVTLLFTSDVSLFMLGHSLSNMVYLDDVTYQMPYYVS